MGRRALLLDWGGGRATRGLDVAGHVEQLLLPLLRSIGEPAALIGYCLGGTMAIAAANLAEASASSPSLRRGISRVIPEDSRERSRTCGAIRKRAPQLGALPMEVLQAAFWSLDPERTVRKFADFGRLDPAAPKPALRRARGMGERGRALPYPAAKELIETVRRDLPGGGEWRVGGSRSPIS